MTSSKSLAVASSPFNLNLATVDGITSNLQELEASVPLYFALLNQLHFLMDCLCDTHVESQHNSTKALPVSEAALQHCSRSLLPR